MSALRDALTGLSRDELAAIVADLPSNAADALLYDWSLWARDEQLPPATPWLVWLILAGRGFGKSRTGAEWIRYEAENGYRQRLALVGATAADVRDVMVEGESGILAVSPPWARPKYEPSKRRLTWPNGVQAACYSADEPDRLRGPQHDGAWADELAAWRYGEAWDMLMFGLRLGRDPRAVVTTTPKPVKVLRELMRLDTTTITRGSTYANRANLAPSFFASIITKYEGTRLGRQELNAELLEDNPSALWKRDTMLDAHRVTKAPSLKRIAVAVDPAATSTGDEAGIIVAGLGDDGHGYLIDDRSLQGSPTAWASAAVTAYHTHKANALVAETNNGGEMVALTISTVPNGGDIRYEAVHASRSKYTRAEPVASLYEQGKVHHVGSFAALEDEYCNWSPGEPSPNRLDAAVWALTWLMLGSSEGIFL